MPSSTSARVVVAFSAAARLRVAILPLTFPSASSSHARLSTVSDFHRVRSGHAESIAWRWVIPSTRRWQYSSWRVLENGMFHVDVSMGQTVCSVSLLGCLALRVRRKRQGEACYDDSCQE